jgi:hypothetical protein
MKKVIFLILIFLPLLTFAQKKVLKLRNGNVIYCKIDRQDDYFYYIYDLEDTNKTTKQVAKAAIDRIIDYEDYTGKNDVILQTDTCNFTVETDEFTFITKTYSEKKRIGNGSGYYLYSLISMYDDKVSLYFIISTPFNTNKVICTGEDCKIMIKLETGEVITFFNTMDTECKTDFAFYAIHLNQENIDKLSNNNIYKIRLYHSEGYNDVEVMDRSFVSKNLNCLNK